MSDIFLKNKKKHSGNVSEFLDTETISSASLPQWLSVVDVPVKEGAIDGELSKKLLHHIGSQVRFRSIVCIQLH